MTKIWKIVKRDLRWQGGTIHQVSKETCCPSSLLLATKNDVVEVKIYNTWHTAIFVSLEGLPLDNEGNRWAKFIAFVPGFNGSGTLTGLRGGVNIR